MKLAIVLALLSALPVFAHTETPQDRVLVRFPTTEAVKAYLREKEIDVTGVDLKKGEVEALVNQDQLLELQTLKAHFNFVIPQTMLRGPDPEYMNPAKIEARLQELAAKYPDLTQLRKVGESLEKRPIWAIKISDNPSVRETSEPTLLFNGMHHAREVMTPEVAMDIADYLLSNYNSDAKVRAWVESNEIWVMPMFNVDGNNRMWSQDSMWRKNARGNFGVDLNRNYPSNWNACNGSSGSTWSQTYRGTGPASEPETNVMMNFVSEIRPVFNISYHSYSELVLYPFGCRPMRTQTAAVVESIGKEMGRLMNYTPGTPWETLYNADGGDIDWMYMEMQVIPYVIEVNASEHGGFHPDYAQWRDKTVVRNRAGWQLLLDRAAGPGVRGVVSSSKTGKLEIDIADASGNKIQIYKVNPDGTYHIILNPGKYTLTFRSERSVLETQSIDVKDRRVTLNKSF
ncbi:MAG: zinc carboxypeptidase [Bacteriovoracaceae bacterium]|nr:zinc carboxypeptidase [Bacteriovoracaceae bacterium]